MNTQHRTASRAKRKYAADPMAIFRVFNKLQAFTPDEQHHLGVPLRMAFERLRTGSGNEADWNELAAAANITMVRSEEIDPLCVETARRAQHALLRAKDRYTRLGVMGLDGQALTDIPLMLDLHEQLVELSTPLQMQMAIRESYARMNRGQVQRMES